MSTNKISSEGVIEENSTVSDIITNNYRNADVFFKLSVSLHNDLEFTLQEICDQRKLNIVEVIKELKACIGPVQINLNYNPTSWNSNFIIDFIINIYHDYFYQHLPIIKSYLLYDTATSEKHLWVPDLTKIFSALDKQLNEQFVTEKLIFFPYVQQITNAELNHEPFASLFVKTLKKPLVEAIEKETQLFRQGLGIIRELTQHYFLPSDATPLQMVITKKLKELDHMLVSYLYLKNDLLFARAIELENKLLGLSFTFQG